MSLEVANLECGYAYARPEEDGGRELLSCAVVLNGNVIPDYHLQC